MAQALLNSDTIVALSSGPVPAGVAVIRVSGPKAFEAFSELAGINPPPRRLVLTPLHGRDGRVLDEALVVRFPAPNSFTGENVVELHCHGSRAVVDIVLKTLTYPEGVRLAERGEFSLRAFLNGRLDLSRLEGLADLIDAETEQQRRLAFGQYRGRLHDLCRVWQEEIDACRARVEAVLDFADEDDLHAHLNYDHRPEVERLVLGLDAAVSSFEAAEIIRDGYVVAIVGKPNAGKSSLLNALAQREVAIVTDQPGTTRDVLEASVQIDGYKVILRDTAGLRESSDEVERIGVERARLAAEDANLVVMLVEQKHEVAELGLVHDNLLIVGAKSDLHGERDWAEATVSSVTSGGLDQFLAAVRARLASSVGSGESGIVVARDRHRDCLLVALKTLRQCLQIAPGDGELVGEQLRVASDAIGRVTGRTEPDALLGRIFSSFCIGK